jgi:hypothetical protein
MFEPSNRRSIDGAKHYSAHWNLLSADDRRFDSARPRIKVGFCHQFDSGSDTHRTAGGSVARLCLSGLNRLEDLTNAACVVQQWNEHRNYEQRESAIERMAALEN